MAEPATHTAQATTTRREARTKRPKLWHVVLLDDQDHSYEYVIELAMNLFGHPIERAFQIAQKVDTDGRAICTTTHREHAELKVEQVHGFGADKLIAGCAGSMTAVMEPADSGDEDDEGHGPDDRR